MPLPREFYIKKGAMKVAPKDLPVVFYVENREDDNTARVATVMCFIGKQSKPAWHYSFACKKRMENRIKEQIESVRISEENKAKRKAEQKKLHTLQVGDILYSSWGYDQTNVDFYKVKQLIGKTMVELIKVGCAHVEGSGLSHGMADQVVAVPEAELGETFKRKANHRNYVKIDSVCGASPWDGNPVYRSWYH